MEKFLKYLAVLLAAALVFSAARFLDNGPSENTDQTPDIQPETSVSVQTETRTEETAAAETETEAPSRSFLLTFAGDCTLGCRDSHAYVDYGFVKVVGEDYGYPFRNVLSYFENDDFTFLNLEGALCDEGNPVKKEHTFRGPTKYVNILTQNSVEMVSLANNHSMDYSQRGYDATKATLESAGIPYVERDNSTIVTLEGGLTIGIYGAVYYLMEADAIAEDIRALSEQVDLVIFAPHWGAEMFYTPTDEQVELARVAIDAGADIVYGCHPHVLQPIEEYNGGIIYYSLGNFSFGGNIYPGDYDSALIQQEVILAGDGTVSLGQTTAVPVCVSSIPDRNNYQPTPYEAGTEAYQRVLEKLALTEDA